MLETWSFDYVVDLLAKIATALGVVGIYLAIRADIKSGRAQQQRDLEAREARIRDLEEQQETTERLGYSSISDKYFAYLNLCMTYPQLNLYYVPLEREYPLNDLDVIRQRALFEILISVMEMAFVLYSDASDATKANQWNGWDIYIRNWCTRALFIRLWAEEYAADPVSGEQFDKRFHTYINGIMKSAGAAAEARADASTHSAG